MRFPFLSHRHARRWDQRLAEERARHVAAEADEASIRETVRLLEQDRLDLWLDHSFDAASRLPTFGLDEHGLIRRGASFGPGGDAFRGCDFDDFQDLSDLGGSFPADGTPAPLASNGASHVPPPRRSPGRSDSAEDVGSCLPRSSADAERGAGAQPPSPRPSARSPYVVDGCIRVDELEGLWPIP